LSYLLIPKNLKTKIYRTVILPVVLYGCETWSLILREERRLRVLENRVLRRVKVNVKVKGNCPCALSNEHHAMKAYWGSGGIAPRIL
jgi:hypothetical protein